jgi:hypothetical protein
MLNYNHQLQRNAGDMREEIDITFLLAVINMFVHPPMFTEWGVYYIRILSLLVILIEWFTSLMWLRYGLRKRTIAKRMTQF